MPGPEPIDQILSALANPARREIVALLARNGDRPVHELAEHFAMSRPSVSEHLKVLKDAGLVTEARMGRERRYSLRPDPLHELRGWLDTYEAFWKERMASLRAVLDDE